MKIVETDNFGGDYPNEKFLNLPSMGIEHAQEVCRAINRAFTVHEPRYWKVVPDNYKLKHGFEP